MRTFIDIIDLWGDIGEFAVDLDIEESHARTMRVRNSIAPTHWSRLVEKARARGFDGISHVSLASAYADRYAAGRATKREESAA